MISASLSYANKQESGVCTVYPLAYTVLSEQHVIIMIIYSFLVCRMLSIYHKMCLTIDPVPSCKARQARRISNCQNPIVLTYFLIYSAFIWTFHSLLVYDEPELMLTGAQEAAFIVFMVPKLIYELSILVIFISLFVKFNRLSKDYQAEQTAQSSHLVTLSKLLTIFICTLYLINTILFDLISPLFWYLDFLRNDGDTLEYTMFLMHLDWIMSLADFLSCMSILFLIHQFGPHRQYLRQANLLKSTSTNSLLTSAPQGGSNSS